MGQGLCVYITILYVILYIILYISFYISYYIYIYLHVYIESIPQRVRWAISPNVNHSDGGMSYGTSATQRPLWDQQRPFKPKKPNPILSIPIGSPAGTWRSKLTLQCFLWKSRDLPLTKKTKLYSEFMLTILTPLIFVVTFSQLSC